MSKYVEIVEETARKCGYRHSGEEGVGIYLVNKDQTGSTCPRLPFPLTVCPCCGSGIKFSRGITRIDPSKLLHPTLHPHPPQDDPLHDSSRCVVCNPAGTVRERGWLLWVGKQHYATAAHFNREAARMGISRRIGAIPNDFRIGEDVVYLAHLEAVPGAAGKTWTPGIFGSFRPTRVELVIDDPDNVPEKAVRLKEKHGDRVQLIKVIPIDGEEHE